jgi:hypothetical protein
MNKTHISAKTGARTRSSIPAERARQSLLESDEFDDIADAQLLPTESDDEDSDWSEVETGAAHAGSRYRQQADDFLAPDVETEINLLLHGVSYR